MGNEEKKKNFQVYCTKKSPHFFLESVNVRNKDRYGSSDFT